MNKEQALQAMREGKKVTHTYFEEHEWMTIVGYKIQLEDNVVISIEEFFKYRDTEDWNEGYSIWGN